MNDLRLILTTMTAAGLVLTSACAGGDDMRTSGMDDASFAEDGGGSTDGADAPDPAAEDDGAPMGGTDGGELPGTDAGADTGDTGADTGADAPVGEDTGEMDTGETGLDPDTGEETGGEETGGEETGEDTGEPPPPMAELDGDNAVNPAVIALFRATSGAPVTVDAPIEGQVDPLDVRGLEYVNAVSDPGDAADWVQFSIVPGQNDPTITITLDCDQAGLQPQPLRATLLDEDDAVLDTIICGEGPQNILLPNASSFDDYRVRVDLVGADHFDAYSLQIDAFCFPTCDFVPLAP